MIVTKFIMSQKLIKNTRFDKMKTKNPYHDDWISNDLSNFLAALDNFGFLSSRVDIHEFKLAKEFFLTGEFKIKFTQNNQTHTFAYVYDFDKHGITTLGFG